MKKLYSSLLVIWLASGGIPAAFADEECANAVDAADSMNVNQKECDYSDQGLNGFLQKAFKKGEEGAVLNTSNNENQTAANAVPIDQNKNASQLAQNRILQLSAEVESWANVALVKQQTLPKLMERCSKGFTVVSESYLPLAMGRLELRIEYKCL
ncbi:hypothetical protein [Cellvibrio fontiphilus]|jgi:ribosomal protein L24|uniref:Uncharacterized protein n=1 Tax=Cellvibrio fontiphilus TaxID=1815559 RepID=A0ABV7FJV3_9GAMM